MNTLDWLTGIPNRDALLEYYNLVQHDQWLVRCDLDRFRLVLEHHGVATADSALVVVATALRSWSRYHDGEAFRLKSDDFVLLMPAVCASQLETDLRSLQSSLPMKKYSYGDHPYRPAPTLTIRFIGVALNRADRETIISTLNRAEDKVQEAKFGSILVSRNDA